MINLDELFEAFIDCAQRIDFNTQETNYPNYLRLKNYLSSNMVTIKDLSESWLNFKLHNKRCDLTKTQYLIDQLNEGCVKNWLNARVNYEKQRKEIKLISINPCLQVRVYV